LIVYFLTLRKNRTPKKNKHCTNCSSTCNCL